MSHDGRPPTYAACANGTCHCKLAEGVLTGDLLSGKDGPYPPAHEVLMAGLDISLRSIREEQAAERNRLT